MKLVVDVISNFISTGHLFGSLISGS